jgi:hypothetical protein
MNSFRTVLVSVLAATMLLAVPQAANCEGDPPAAEAGSDTIFLAGDWRGAKLRCRKEEGKTVRCGKPEAFMVSFREDGTGSSEDEKFPSSFTYRWKSETEITVIPDDGTEELKLFQLEHEEGFLTFQAYIYLPVENPDLPAEVNYIHYIFDVSREE